MKYVHTAGRRKGERYVRRGLRDVSAMPPVLRRALKVYATRLLESHEISRIPLEFVMEMLGDRDRQLLLRRLQRAKRAAAPLETSKWPQRDADDWASLIMKVILDGTPRAVVRDELLRLFYRGRHGGSTASPLPAPARRFAEVQRLFKLTDDEVAVVCVFYCIMHCESFRKLFPSRGAMGAWRVAACCTGRNGSAIRKAIATDSSIAKAGILVHALLNDTAFELEDGVANYLSGLDGTALVRSFCRKDPGSTFNLKTFQVPPRSIDIIQGLLSSPGPASILLYGQSGAGKTEFARALAASVGRTAYFVNQESDGRRSRQLAVQGAAAALPPDRSLLIVDEADSFLNTRLLMLGGRMDTPDKGWLNTFLSASKHKVIWITNHTEQVEESSLRRFSYSLRFKPFTRREREYLWAHLARKHPLRRILSENLIRDLTARYEVSAGGITSALDALTKTLPAAEATPEKVRDLLYDLLEKHLEATGHRKAGTLNLLTGNYDITALNTSADPRLVIDGLSKFGETTMAAGTRPDGHVNLLFWGRPGTGKTEFAKYLADRLQMGLIHKRASDLLSPFVGVTEMLMRDAFEHAERDGSILFLDEADSFFINRETAMRSWETSQTNELLTQMENFKGILICCTNLLDHLDKAALRRFAWKIEFKPLTAEGRLAVYGKYFPLENELSVADRERLLRIQDVTPGDIKAVWDKFRYGDPAQVTHAGIVEALEQESGYHAEPGGRIGFGAAG
jgi:transitional endoplasmic reticulum ATPase